MAALGLQAIMTIEGEDVYLALSGVIDEICSLPAFDQIPGRLYIDLEKLTMINSIGCRNWVQWFRDKVRAKGGVSLIKCSPAIIHQVNILSGFLPPGVSVDSFYVPYFCDGCGYEEQMLLTRGIDFNDNQVLAEVGERACPACSALMAPDIIKKRYFQFITKKAS